MPKYGKKAGEKVESAMQEMQEGSLKSGSGAKVTDPKQAIAIGLSEAREAGGKVPTKKSPAKKSSSGGSKKAAFKKSEHTVEPKKTAAPKKGAAKKTATKKKAATSSNSAAEKKAVAPKKSVTKKAATKNIGSKKD